jgi:hypothetical protein
MSVGMARQIHNEKRLTVRVPREVWVKLREEETIMSDDPSVRISKGDGRMWRPKQAQIAEAVLANYLSLPLVERLPILRYGMERLNAMIERRDPNLGDEPTPKPKKLVEVDLDPPSPRKKGRRD